MRYRNPFQKRIYRGLVHFLLWRIGFYREKLPAPIPEKFSFPNACEEVDLDKPLVTWVNHSTFWVRAYGKSLLVDPIWSERCSPLPFVGPKRHHPPEPGLDQITSLDLVIISHNHYDHLDASTVSHLLKRHPQALWVVPSGVKKWFRSRFPSADVRELSWWQQSAHKEIKLTALPAQHFSGRGLFDRNRSHWMGCMIEFKEGKRLYFAGDTGYNDFDFKEIKKKFPQIDLSLVPIGVYRPRAFMRPVHVSPVESIQIHQEVGSKLSVAGHWGTFRLSNEEITRPPYDLFCSLQSANISPQTFRVLKPGQSVNW